MKRLLLVLGPVLVAETRLPVQASEAVADSGPVHPRDGGNEWG